MPGEDTHGLQIALATALRERDEAIKERDRQIGCRNIAQADRNAYELQNEALRAEVTRLREDVADLLTIAERAHRKEPCFSIGSPDYGLEDGLRVAREGALIMRLRDEEEARAALGAGGDRG